MVEIIPIALGMVSVYLLKGEQAALVDTGMRQQRARLLKGLQAAGLAPGGLELVIHTHLHVDHAGSSRYLQQQGAKLAVHAAECDELEQGRSAPVNRAGGSGGPLGSAFPGARADVIITDRLDLRPFGLAGEVIHTPGHTAGSVSVVVTGPGGQPCIVAGDLFLGGPLLGLINTRRPHKHMIINDLEQMWRSVRRLLDYEPTLVYLGHGGPVSGVHLKAWYDKNRG